jgi:hypothetical protein
MQRASASSPSTPKSTEPPSKRQRLSTASGPSSPSISREAATRGEKELERQAAALGETKWALSVRPPASQQTTTNRGLRVVDASWADLSSDSSSQDESSEDGKRTSSSAVQKNRKKKSTPGRFAFGKRPRDEEDEDGSDEGRGAKQRRDGAETDSSAQSFSDGDVLDIIGDSKNRSKVNTLHGSNSSRKKNGPPWDGQQSRRGGGLSQKPRPKYANGRQQRLPSKGWQ